MSPFEHVRIAWFAEPKAIEILEFESMEGIATTRDGIRKEMLKTSTYRDFLTSACIVRKSDMNGTQSDESDELSGLGVSGKNGSFLELHLA